MKLDFAASEILIKSEDMYHMGTVTGLSYLPSGRGLRAWGLDLMGGMKSALLLSTWSWNFSCGLWTFLAWMNLKLPTDSRTAS